jgi:hypothetical protein
MKFVLFLFDSVNLDLFKFKKHFVPNDNTLTVHFLLILSQIKPTAVLLQIWYASCTQ